MYFLTQVAWLMLIFDGSHFVFFRFLLSKMMRMMMIRSCSYLQSPLQFHVFDFSCLKSFLCIVTWHHASYTNQWQLHSECQKISRVKADKEEKVRQRESGIEFNLIRSLDVRSIVFFMAFFFSELLAWWYAPCQDCRFFCYRCFVVVQYILLFYSDTVKYEWFID